MKRTFYRLFLVTIFSVLIVSCGGDDGGVVNTAPVNTDCVLGASKIGDCTI